MRLLFCVGSKLWSRVSASVQNLPRPHRDASYNWEISTPLHHMLTLVLLTDCIKDGRSLRDVTHWFLDCRSEASSLGFGQDLAILTVLKPDVNVIGGDGGAGRSWGLGHCGPHWPTRTPTCWPKGYPRLYKAGSERSSGKLRLTKLASLNWGKVLINFDIFGKYNLFGSANVTLRNPT